MVCTCNFYFHEYKKQIKKTNKKKTTFITHHKKDIVLKLI